MRRNGRHILGFLRQKGFCIEEPNAKERRYHIIGLGYFSTRELSAFAQSYGREWELPCTGAQDRRPNGKPK